MNTRQIALTAVLVPFLGLTAYVVTTVGFAGFYEQALSSPATILMGFDLIVALGLVLLWMQQDAREHGLSILFYVAVTLVIGVAGPLLYLLRRESASRAAHRPVATSA